MSVTFTVDTNDLRHILKQIQIAEEFAAPGNTRTLQDIIGQSAALLPFGLRAVDGSNNNLLPGQSLLGAADQPFPRLLPAQYTTGTGGPFDTNGPAPGGVVSNNDYAQPGTVIDTSIRTASNLISDMSPHNPAAVAAWFANPIAQQAYADAHGGAAPPQGYVPTATELAFIPNQSPDIGLSPPFNGWMTLFGQFFDHGLDLVTKGGNGSVIVPLMPDDPLIAGKDGTFGTADDLPAAQRFMTLTRATPVAGPGADGVLGTADDTRESMNTTTPWIDQNQTYTSHPSHQVFLREYVRVDTTPNDGVANPVTLATGRLLNGGADGKAIANWAEVKAQAKAMLGIELVDTDIHNVPVLMTDPYGKFIPGPNGFAQMLMQPDATHATTWFKEGTAAGISTAGAVMTGHAFLDDIANTADPVVRGRAVAPDADTDVGNAIPVGPDGTRATYDNELLDRHFITGDGRGNENIGLTAVHTIFHSEHNRLVEANKATILASGDLAFINEWLRVDVTALPTTPQQVAALQWDGERLFQAAKFVTEMQYQHLVFEEFARTVQPNVDPFVFTNSADLNPAITAEFAHVVYRFGHSMLDDTIDRLGFDMQPVDADPNAPGNQELGLIEAFLNPLAFTASGVDTDAAAGAIIRGMTRQVGNEIDEFVVDSLRNNLLGLPLDLPVLNMARAREQGVPSLNEARAEFYAMTSDVKLKPYTSWVDFAQNIKNPASVINFIAAYGQHDLVTQETTLAGKRAAATALVFGTPVDVPDDPATPAVNEAHTIQPTVDRLDFLYGTGAWNAANSGLDKVDFWIGGLAEEKMEFGGMLGNTFNFVFENQLEHLQNGDRFYYLSRTQGMNLLNELEANTFSALVQRNTDLGTEGSSHLNGSLFGRADHILELNQPVQVGADPTQDDPLLQIIDPKVVRVAPGADVDGDGHADGGMLKFSGGEHVVLGGTEGNDRLIGDKGIDTLWGDGGDDYLNGGMESDQIFGGDGDDVIEDPFGDEFIRGGEGNDAISGGPGLDILFGGGGKDFITHSTDPVEVFAGRGDDFVLGGSAGNGLMGNEGNDWIEGGEGFDSLSGENSQLFFNSIIIGHDVLDGQGNDTDYDGESGDDIMVQGPGIQRNNGMLGFDWVIQKGDPNDGTIDLGISQFATQPALILRDRNDSVEGASGWKHDDTLIGTDRPTGANGPGLAGIINAPPTDSMLLSQNVALIDGLEALLKLTPAALRGQVVGTDATAFADLPADTTVFDPQTGNDILLGGAGSDTFTGKAGNDIIDGDRWLNVRLSIRDAAGHEIATADSLAGRMFTTPAGLASGTGPLFLDGMTLKEALMTRAVNPGQLNIVREIVDAGKGSDIDTAVFSDVRANYTFTDIGGGSLRVEHTGFSARAVTKFSDGTDTLHNIERLRFADGTVDVNLVLDQPFARFNLVAPDGDIGAINAVFTGLEAGRPVTVDWQVLNADGTWRAATAGDGTVADAPGGVPGDRFVPAGPNVEVRAVASWTSTLAGVTGPQLTPTAETGLVGTSGNENLDGSTSANVILGLAGDDRIRGNAGADVIDGGDGNDRLDGGAGNDVLRGNDGDDVLVGRTGDNTLQGGTGDDQLSGGAGNDSVDGGVGTDTVLVAGPVEAYAFERAGAVITVTDNLGAAGDGRDTLTGVEFLQDGGGDVFAIGAAGTAGADIVVGSAAGETLTGGAGDDLVFAGGGADTVTWGPGDGRDFVDGGTGVDTVQVNGGAAAETFRVYSRAAWVGVAGNVATALNPNTEIVITRNGTDAASIVAELDNVEEIRVNTLQVTSPAGAAGGTSAGDAIRVIGDFTATSLNFNTITIDGTAGDDTVDISGLASAHRIVFRSGGGADTIVGTLRPQDVIELAPGTTRVDYAETQSNGMTTLTHGTHSITFASTGTPSFGTAPTGGGGSGGTAGGTTGGTGTAGGFALTAADLDGLRGLVTGQPGAGGEGPENAAGVRHLSGAGNNLAHPEYGAADQPFIRLTQAHYDAYDPATNNDAVNPIFAGLDPRAISNVLGTQEPNLPKQADGANIFFMAFGQYFDHGLDFLPKSPANGTVEIGGPGSLRSPTSDNPADLTRGAVDSIDANGVPQHLNKTSPFADQNQAYGSHELVGQFLRESDGHQGVGAHLLAGAPDPSNPAFNLLPTLRVLIEHHWDANTVFHDPSLPGGSASFRDYYSNYAAAGRPAATLVDPVTGAIDAGIVKAMADDFMGSGNALLLDANPFVNLLDHYVAGDGRANENVSLTAMHTVWARNHNFHVDNLMDAGFQGTPEEVFQAAKMINEAEYQRVVFTEFADHLIGGIKGSGDHGHAGYNPSADARISEEFAAAVYRVGHSLIGQTLSVMGADGQPHDVKLVDAFLNPTNEASAFTVPLPPGYVPQPGYAQLGAGAILAGVAAQPAEEVDFNIVDAVRNDLVRINADLFAFNVARGRDVGLGTLNQVRADLQASSDPYVHEAVGYAGNLDPYASWEDFQARNGLSDAVIAQFRQAYPDLVLDTPEKQAAFAAANPDVAMVEGPNGTRVVAGIDRVDLWVGGLAEKHINGGMVGQTFWTVLHEQFDRLQEGDRLYYLDRFDNFDFYRNTVEGQTLSDIVARNTGLTGLQEDIFTVGNDGAQAGGGAGAGNGTGAGADGNAGHGGGPLGEGTGAGTTGTASGGHASDGQAASGNGTGTAGGSGSGTQGGSGDAANGSGGGHDAGGAGTQAGGMPGNAPGGHTGDAQAGGSSPGAGVGTGTHGNDAPGGQGSAAGGSTAGQAEGASGGHGSADAQSGGGHDAGGVSTQPTDSAGNASGGHAAGDQAGGTLPGTGPGEGASGGHDGVTTNAGGGAGNAAGTGGASQGHGSDAEGAGTVIGAAGGTSGSHGGDAQAGDAAHQGSGGGNDAASGSGSTGAANGSHGGDGTHAGSEGSGNHQHAGGGTGGGTGGHAEHASGEHGGGQGGTGETSGSGDGGGHAGSSADAGAPGTGHGDAGGGQASATGTPPASADPHLVTGTTHEDVLVGTAGADTVLGLAGDDDILAGDGADVVRAGTGDDFVDAGAGRDVVFGGEGNDDILAGDGADMVYGDAGADRILAGEGDDLVTGGAGDDRVIGGGGDDLFVAEAGDGNDTYWGDEVGGGAGIDTLDMSAIAANIAVNLGTGLAGRGSAASAESGSDTLWGIENVVTGSGDDTITASDAVNVMDGGAGADTYRFVSTAAANGDTIASFQPGDKVDLGGIDANQGVAGDQAFTLATGAAFTGVGQLLITQEHRADGDYTVVAGNTAGDAAPEFKFAIKGAPAATAADFTL